VGPPKSEVTDAQYQEFYKQMSYDSEAPLAYTHNRVEGRSEYTQLLYIPAKAPFDLWNRDKRGGVKLYVKRVFIMDDAEALMPVYLRFVKGVIDSADLPLNVSRELLQESRDVKAIREGCTKRVLGMLESTGRQRQRRRQGQVRRLLERVRRSAQGGHRRGPRQPGAPGQAAALRLHARRRRRVLRRLRVAHEGGPGAIYYITADSLAAAKSSPQLEIFRKKGIEVLLLTDRVDEWMLEPPLRVRGQALQSVAKGAVDLGKLQDEDEKKQAEASRRDLQAGARAAQGRPEGARQGRAHDHPPGRFTRLHRRRGRRHERPPGAPAQAGRPERARATQPILEVNAEHALVRRLAADDARFDDLAPSCSTRPCWPRVVSSTTRPPMCSG
jgi:molecular chaperone HtpG